MPGRTCLGRGRRRERGRVRHDPRRPRRGVAGGRIVFAPGVSIAGADMSGIAAAREICQDADIVLLCLGEGANMSGEAASRANPGLPGVQSALAEAIFDLGKPVVALISSGRPLMIAAIVEKARAIVATWFLGAEAGNAIADVLTGKFNPTGRFPSLGRAMPGNCRFSSLRGRSGRPANPDDHYTSKYLDMPVEPLFFFGHGLSYSRFALTNLRVNKADFKRGDELTIEVDVLNEGPAAGEATVFLFARDMVASVARPLLELKGVGKIALASGRCGTVCFKLAAAALAFPGTDLKPVFEPGEFLLLAGQSADPRGLLTIKCTPCPTNRRRN